MPPISAESLSGSSKSKPLKWPEKPYVVCAAPPTPSYLSALSSYHLALHYSPPQPQTSLPCLEHAPTPGPLHCLGFCPDYSPSGTHVISLLPSNRTFLYIHSSSPWRTANSSRTERPIPVTTTPNTAPGLQLLAHDKVSGSLWSPNKPCLVLLSQLCPSAVPSSPKLPVLCPQSAKLLLFPDNVP